MTDEQDMLVTRHQAARAAGVTYNTIQLWIRAGRLHPVVPPGKGRPSILWSELVALMQKTLAKESSELWDSKRSPHLGTEPAGTG